MSNPVSKVRVVPYKISLPPILIHLKSNSTPYGQTEDQIQVTEGILISSIRTNLSTLGVHFDIKLEVTTNSGTSKR